MAVEELKYSSNNQPVTIKNKESNGSIVRSTIKHSHTIFLHRGKLSSPLQTLNFFCQPSTNYSNYKMFWHTHSLTNIQYKSYDSWSNRIKKKNNENIVKRERKKKNRIPLWTCLLMEFPFWINFTTSR